MKLEKFMDVNILAGIVFGLLIGLHYPVDAHKAILSILAVVLGLKVVGVLK